MRLDPPGLPPPLVDERAELGAATPLSSWDALAVAAIEMKYQLYSSNARCRVKWVRRCLCHWCCWRPMRLGRVEYQPTNRVFGWSRAPWKFAACRRCGQIDSSLL